MSPAFFHLSIALAPTFNCLLHREEEEEKEEEEEQATVYRGFLGARHHVKSLVSMTSYDPLRAGDR